MKRLIFIVLLLLPIPCFSASSGGIVEASVADNSVTAAKMAINWALSGSEGGSALQCVAFASNPTDCSVGQFANAIDINGNLTCAVAGDVLGPASATDECFARFDLTTGKIIQNSVICATDTGNLLLRTSEVSPTVTIVAGNKSASSAAKFNFESGGTSGLGGDICFGGGVGESCFIAGAFGYDRFDFIRNGGLTADNKVLIYNTASGTRSSSGFANYEAMHLTGTTGSKVTIEAISGGTGSSNINFEILAKGTGNILLGGHIVTLGSSPSVGGSCGTSPSIVGKDTSFRITTGTDSPTSCTVTFFSSFSNAPICVANASNTTTVLNITSSTTTVTISAASLTASETINVICLGY